MWDNLKASIASVVRTNNNQEITGANLQSVLNTIVNTVGANATFAGIAVPSTNPGTPDGPVFYIACEPGIYSNFNITIVDGLYILENKTGSWVGTRISTGGAFDISAYHATGGVLAKYVDLSAALDGGNNIPKAIRKGGMSVKFVQNSDNKYVRYFLTKNEWSTSETDWEKMNLKEELAELAGELTLTAADLLTDVDKTLSNGTIVRANTPNTWYVTNDYYGYWYHISNYRGKTLEIITGNITGNCLFAFTTVIESSNRNVVDYASGSAAIVISENTKQNVVIPADANYLYVQTYANGEDRTPQSLKVYGSIKDKLEDVDQIPSKGSTKFVTSGGVYAFEPVAPVTLSFNTNNMAKSNCSLVNNGTWGYASSSGAKHIVISCKEGDVFTLTVTTTQTTGGWTAWLTSSYVVPSDGDTVPYVSGQYRVWRKKDTEISITAPTGAAYLCVCTTDGDRKVSSWTITQNTYKTLISLIDNKANNSDMAIQKAELETEIEASKYNIGKFDAVWSTNNASIINATKVGNDIFVSIASTSGTYRTGFDISGISIGETLHVEFTSSEKIVFGVGETLTSSWIEVGSFTNGFTFKKTSATQKYLYIPAYSYYPGGANLTLQNFRVFRGEPLTDIISSLHSYNFNPSSYIPIKEGYENYMSISTFQGTALYGNYLVTWIYGNMLCVYNLASKTTVQIRITLPTFANTRTHANTMSFSSTKYDNGDDFPLLYICTGYTDTTSVSTSEVYVVRIIGTAGSYTTSLIQTITLDFGITNGWTEFVVDPVKNRAWINGSRIDTYICITIPDITESSVTINAETPIIDHFNTKTFTLGTTTTSYGQGRFFYHNRVYWVSGVPSYTGQGEESLYIVVDNTLTHCTEAVIPLINYGLSNGTDNTYEPEGCFIWNDDFYVAYRTFAAKLIQN